MAVMKQSKLIYASCYIYNDPKFLDRYHLGKHYYPKSDREQPDQGFIVYT